METPAQRAVWVHPPSGAARRRRRRAIATTVVIAIVVLVGVGAAILIATVGRGAQEAPRLAVYSDTTAAEQAAQAAEGSAEQRAAAYLAAQATAVWLVPERDPIGEVGSRVAALADEARAQDAVSTIVVYGLPERDCGSYSAGGLEAADYATWTAEIGAAIRESGVSTIVVLEPDSIALSNECGDIEDRAEQLQTAVANLSGDEARIYIDGGHSNWHSAATMAEMIRSMGVIDDVRGFTTNVSNYNSDGDEFAYAHELSGLLGGAHAIVDTGRNGAGSDGQWCNPPGRLIGTAPGALGDEVVDLNLWVKVPGESDGTCNGGPAAGEWWSQSAIELTREAVG